MSTTPERESRTLHQKKPQLDRIHEGYPPKNSGYEGELRIHNIKGEGLRLYIRKNKEWYFSTLSTTGTVATTTTSSGGGGGSGDITSVTAGTGLSGGGTTGDVTLTNAGVTSNVAGTGISVNASTGAVTITNAGVTSNVAGTGIAVSAATGAVTISVSGLTVSELAANSLQTSGESFSDNDTSLMTSAAIQDKIQSFSYITLSSLSASAPITYDNSSGAFSIADHAITLAKLPEIATARFLGRNTSGTGDVEVMTVTQVGALLSLDSYLTAPRTVTAGGNTLASSETLAFVAGSNVTITESGGSVTIASTDTNTDTVDMGDGFRLVDVDSNVQVTENKYVKFKTASGGSGFGDITGGDGSSGNPWIYQLQYTDTNTTYSVMGSGNSYAAGLVLAGASSHGNTYLRKDGTWTLPSIHIQDDDGDSLTVDIDEHIKITGTGGISTDWTTDDAGGSGAPNVLTIGLGSITQVGALSQGSIASGFQTIDEGFIDSAIVRKNANTTITGIYTFSGKGIVINAGSGNDVSGYDTALYISATSNNDWGIWIDKSSNNYGIKVDVAADASAAFGVYNDSTNRFMITGSGVVTTGTWNGSVIGSAYLDADTAHLSGTQTFSGAKTFSSTTTFSNTSSYGDLDIIPTSSNVSIIKHDSGSGSLTLRGDQIRLQNRDGDDTGLTYNDAGGVTFGGRINVTEIRGSELAIKDSNADLMAYFQDGSSRIYSNGYNLRLESSNELNLYNGNTATTLHISYNGTGSSTDISNTELTVIKGTGSRFYGSVQFDNVLKRGNHHIGHFEGSYNNVGGNSSYSNPIYTIGSSYNPGSTTLANMYGIGYAHSNLWGTSDNRPPDWGMYAAADGDVRVILEASTGIVWAASGFRTSRGSLSGVDNSHHELRSLSNAAVGLKLSSNGNLRGWLYANDYYETGFLNTSGNWDLRKTAGSHLLVYGSGSNIAKFGSGDEWGRIEFDNFSNGTYVYLNQGDFRVDGGHWNPYGNADTNLGSDSLRWNNIWINSVAQVGQVKLNNNFKWEQGSSDYGRFSSWLQGGGTAGMYFPNSGMTSSPHFYPTGSGYSYGTFIVSNGMAGYAGILHPSHSNRPTVMFADSTSSGGIYYQGTGRWAVYHNYGDNCLGVDTSSTDSAYELKVNGDILATGDVVAFSDARWKTEIETISNPIDKIMDMRGVYYRELPKGDKKVSDRRKMGVIAQEILKVAPEVVTYGETNDEYAVDYSKLVGILIEGIKELKQEINELKGN